jgi:protein-tyrosine-phosphatase
MTSTSFLDPALEILNVATFRERSDTFVLDDPAPGVIDFVSLVRSVLSLVERRIQLAFLSVSPVRKTYLSKAQRAFFKGHNVLFVCKGNICRSPFAQRYAQQKFPQGWSFASSGYYPRSQRMSPSVAVSVAREFGVNLLDHRSTELSPQAVHDADIIITFDEEDRRTLLERYPAARNKGYLMGMFSVKAPLIIKDPFGAPTKSYRSTYETIARIIDAIVLASEL